MKVDTGARLGHYEIVAVLGKGGMGVPAPAGGGPSSTGGAFLNAPFLDKSNGLGPGSLYSTIGDLHRWTLALFGGKFLRAGSLTKMTTPVLGEYAYGITVGTSEGRRRFLHGGSIPGFVSVLAYYPESRVTVAVLTNSSSPTPNERRALVVADWLGTLAHGGTVTLPAKR